MQVSRDDKEQVRLRWKFGWVTRRRDRRRVSSPRVSAVETVFGFSSSLWVRQKVKARVMAAAQVNTNTHDQHSLSAACVWRWRGILVPVSFFSKADFQTGNIDMNSRSLQLTSHRRSIKNSCSSPRSPLEFGCPVALEILSGLTGKP